jgi:hypothetical protein
MSRKQNLDSTRSHKKASARKAPNKGERHITKDEAMNMVTKVAALAASATAIQQVSTTPSRDPIFERIEKHRSMVEVFRCLNAREIKLSDREVMRTQRAFDVQAWAMLENPPLTAEGAAALLRYSAEVEQILDDEAWPDGSEGGVRPGEIWKDELRRVVSELLAAQPVSSASGSAAPSVDPIFAVIRKFRETNEAFLKRSDLEERLVEEGKELTPAPGDFRTPEMIVAVEAASAAQRKLAETSPTTLEGLLSYLDLVASETQTSGSFVFGDDGDETRTFIRSLGRAARGLSRSAKHAV